MQKPLLILTLRSFYQWRGLQRSDILGADAEHGNAHSARQLLDEFDHGFGRSYGRL